MYMYVIKQKQIHHKNVILTIANYFETRLKTYHNVDLLFE